MTPPVQSKHPAAAAVPMNPLSRGRHEFVWEGKYDAQGRRRKPDAPPLPLRLLEEWAGPVDASSNLLLHGDNMLVMAALLPRFRRAIDLIYIDPPYDCGLDYTLEVPVGEAATATVHAYRDAWGRGRESYPQMMAERLMLMKELLHPAGCIFVHCDWRANAVIRLLLDEVFGPACFRNEIVWRRAPNVGRQAASSQLGRVVDSIFVYSAREGTPFRGQVPMRSRAVELDRTGKPRNCKWDAERRLYFTTAPRGDYTDESIARLRSQGRIYESSTGKIYIKYFLRRGDDGRWYKDAPVDTLWDDPEVRPLRHCSKDELDIGYATQKPEGLLRRIIAWASPPGGLVADFFCGSGTTGAAAQQLGRRWIMADLGRQAIHTARKRMIELQRRNAAVARPFSVFDLGCGERAQWRRRADIRDDRAYRHHVLARFDARCIDSAKAGDEPVHGWRAQAACHVAAPDSLFDASSAGEVARAALRAGAAEVFCLAWEFEPGIRHAMDSIATQTGITLRPVPIPREIMDPNQRVLPPWMELPRIAASLFAHIDGTFDLRIERFEPIAVQSGPGDGHAPVSAGSHTRRARDGSDCIDAWSVDFDHARGEPFRPDWHTHRRGRQRIVKLESDAHWAQGADASGVCLVKVVDVFGFECWESVAHPS
ncbi:MAG: hypothetical protein Kow0022_15840 [Phycisphaerales bacterium]